MKTWWTLPLLVPLACETPVAPCPTVETRYVARVGEWNVVCLEPEDGLQWCAIWPTPPMPPDWVGDPIKMAAHGYPLREVIVCDNVGIVDTPI